MDINARVLAVDGDETVLRYYCRVLAGANCAVRTAKTGEEAQEMFAHEAFDVVLMEYVIPGSDGHVVLRAIKDVWPDTEVVVITAAPSVGHAKEAIRLGACDYLAKPVPADEIVKVAARAALQKKWTLHRIPARDPVQLTH